MRGIVIYLLAVATAAFGIWDRHTGHSISADVEMVGSFILLALGWIYDLISERK